MASLAGGVSLSRLGSFLRSSGWPSTPNSWSTAKTATASSNQTAGARRRGALSSNLTTCSLAHRGVTVTTVRYRQLRPENIDTSASWTTVRSPSTEPEFPTCRELAGSMIAENTGVDMESQH